MKQVSNLLRAIFGLALMGMLGVVLVLAFQAASRSNQAFNLSVTTTCAPTPALWATDVGTPTNTPAPSQITTPVFSPSVTPLPISKITDLSPDVSIENKGQVVVFHCDGTFEMFLTAGTEVPLQSGDIVVVSSSPLHGRYVPPPPTEITPLPSSTTLLATPSGPPGPYPYPIPIQHRLANSEYRREPSQCHSRLL